MKNIFIVVAAVLCTAACVKTDPLSDKPVYGRAIFTCTKCGAHLTTDFENKIDTLYPIGNTMKFGYKLGSVLKIMVELPVRIRVFDKDNLQRVDTVTDKLTYVFNK